jgi:hypothetical protein
MTIATQIVADVALFTDTDGFAEPCQYQIGDEDPVEFDGIWTEAEATEEDRDHGRVWVRRAELLVATATITAPSRLADWSRDAASSELWNLVGVEDQQAMTRLVLIREERIDTSARKERTR